MTKGPFAAGDVAPGGAFHPTPVPRGEDEVLVAPPSGRRQPQVVAPSGPAPCRSSSREFHGVPHTERPWPRGCAKGWSARSCRARIDGYNGRATEASRVRMRAANLEVPGLPLSAGCRPAARDGQGTPSSSVQLLREGVLLGAGPWSLRRRSLRLQPVHACLPRRPLQQPQIPRDAASAAPRRRRCEPGASSRPTFSWSPTAVALLRASWCGRASDRGTLSAVPLILFELLVGSGCPSNGRRCARPRASACFSSRSRVVRCLTR
jgi:hypothetical protein